MFGEYFQHMASGPVLASVGAGLIDYAVSMWTGVRPHVESVLLLGNYQISYQLYSAVQVALIRYGSSAIEQTIEEFIPLNARAKAVEGALLGPLGSAVNVAAAVWVAKMLPISVVKIPDSANPIVEGFLALATTSVANQFVKVIIPALTGEEVYGVN